MTGYETLQQAVADALKNLNDAKAKLVTLQNDSTFILFKSILADPRVQADANSWISSTGEWWNSVDAPAAHQNGVRYVNEMNGKIAAQQTVIADAQKTLDAATTALTNYEKNSPIGQQAAASQKDADSKRALVITVVIIAIVVVGTSITIYFVRKNKKKKSE